MAVADNDFQQLVHLTFHYETFNFGCYYPQWLQQLSWVYKCVTLVSFLLHLHDVEQEGLPKMSSFSTELLHYFRCQIGPSETFYSVQIRYINIIYW